MTREVIIDVQPKEITIGLMEDGRLAEYQRDCQDASFSVGNIYLARVKKLMPGLNAAFVDVGGDKEGFLHYQDLGLHFATMAKFAKQQLSDRRHMLALQDMDVESDLPKEGTIANILQVGQDILVQVSKEPISTKGARLTGEISLPGRFMVLMPLQDKVSVSAKIKSAEEKNRLKQIVNEVRPRNFGVIIRTSAKDAQAEELQAELAALMRKWEGLVRKLMKGQVPSLVYEEISRPVALLRDLFDPSFENIWVNDTATYEQIKDYVSLIAPEKANVVKLYKEETPILDKFDVTRQIKSSLGKTVSCKAGAYIIIEHTEALHVIDVNSGHRSHQADAQEENALAVDMAAAEEIARQMRLRDMGGIVVIDFIDLQDPTHRETLYKHMKELMQGDRAKHNILPLSKFCLMQITRQRVRPVMDIQTAESCPVCGGLHVIKPSILYPEIMASKLEWMNTQFKLRRFYLHVHPFVAAYLRSGGFRSWWWRWKLKYGFRFHLVTDQSMEVLQYKVMDGDGNEVNLKQPIDNHV